MDLDAYAERTRLAHRKLRFVMALTAFSALAVPTMIRAPGNGPSATKPTVSVQVR